MQKFYQNIPNGLRDIDIFHGLSGDKIFMNWPVTKSSQTVRWQNQMFDYRAHSESWPSVSIDFLRVVQLEWVFMKHYAPSKNNLETSCLSRKSGII